MVSESSPRDRSGNTLIVKAHCPRCGPGRNADVAAEYINRWDEDDVGIWGIDTHRILRCRGCEAVFHQEASVFSEEVQYSTNPITGEDESSLPETIKYWPAPSKRDAPSWFYSLMSADHELHSLMIDVYTALDNSLDVLAAIGIRTAFDRATEGLGIEIGLSFAKKLQALFNDGNIGADEHAILNILTDAGSAAAHRGWRPKADELDTMMSVLEQFIHRNFILGTEAAKLKSSVPPRATV